MALQNQLWALAGDALKRAPNASAPRLYVETLNEMIDAHTTRVAALDNRIPAPVLWLQILASALALGVLGMFLASHDRGVLMALLAAVLVTVMLLVIFDLDRPHRGMITISDAPLVAERASMNSPPAATGPGRRTTGSSGRSRRPRTVASYCAASLTQHCAQASRPTSRPSIGASHAVWIQLETDTSRSVAGAPVPGLSVRTGARPALCVLRRVDDRTE